MRESRRHGDQCVLLTLVSAKRRAAGPAVKSKPTQKLSTKQKVKKTFKWMAVSALALAILATGAFVVLYTTIELPDPNADFETQTTFVYYADGKQEIGRFEQQNRESIPLKKMPEVLQDAVIAAENRSFWTDSGLDPKGIARAFFSNAQGNAQQGASTITQQYIKILYLNQERSYTRKIKEAILSLKIQREMTKSEILEGYLNTIFFGRSAYGVQAASRAYFDIPADELNLRQSAVLASVINNPNNLDPADSADAKAALLERYRYTLGSMATMGVIDDATAEKAKRKLPKFPTIEAESRLGGQKGHMLALVRRELNALGYSDQQIDRDGLRVTATFDPTVMDAAKKAVIEQRPEGFGDKDLHVGAATVEVGTGAVRGFYGGQDYLQSQINWAATGAMAGSTMKAYANAAAIAEGFSLKDSFDGNSPYAFPGGLEVNNQGFVDYGQVSMLRATEKSINTAYMDMTQSMTEGPRKIYEMARRLGIPGADSDPKFPGIPKTSPDFTPEDTLVALGRGRVSPINMANGYASIANSGRRADAHVVQKVVTRTGETVYQHKDTTKQVLDQDIADDVSYSLQQVVQVGTGTAARVINRPAAGKTGTATNSKDQVSSAWFVGYTPQLSTAVVYLRGDGDDGLDGWLPLATGGGYPARTWAALMGVATDGMEVKSFPPPVFVDGEAPSTGHEYVAPPAPPSRPQPQPKPKPSKKPEPSKKPKPTKKPEPTQPPPPPTTQAPPEAPTPPPSPTPPPPAPTQPTVQPNPDQGRVGSAG